MGFILWSFQVILWLALWDSISGDYEMLFIGQYWLDYADRDCGEIPPIFFFSTIRNILKLLNNGTCELVPPLCEIPFFFFGLLTSSRIIVKFLRTFVNNPGIQTVKKWFFFRVLESLRIILEVLRLFQNSSSKLTRKKNSKKIDVPYFSNSKLNLNNRFVQE